MYEELIATGSWDDNTSWELYIADTLPDIVSTAVCCIAFSQIDPPKVVTTRNHRGWELMAGHIEPGESLLQAMVRECIEEGGFTPTSYKLLGYRKVTAKVPSPNNHHGGFYPLVSLVPQYMALSSLPIAPHSGEEILESAAFFVADLPKMESSQHLLVGEAVKQLKLGRLTL